MKLIKNEPQDKKLNIAYSSEASCIPSETNQEPKFAKQIVPWFV